MSSLRSRIVAVMFALALLSSTVLALGVYIASEELEETVLSHTILQEASFLEEIHDHPDPTGHSALLTVHRDRDGRVPAALSGLGLGEHHGVQIADREYQVLVREDPDGRVYLAYDITEWEDKERLILRVLVIGIGLVTLLAIPLGFWSSRQITAPVTALAEQVSKRGPRARSGPLGERFRGQELEPIARAVDEYGQRLERFVEREQVFTSSASHELRTPLSVMQGALEILEEESHSDRSGRAVERMSRAVREMSEYIDALLEIAREEITADADAGTEIGDLVSRLVAEQKLLGGNAAPITVTLEEPLRVPVPASMPSIVISNLLRNALLYTPCDGGIRVSLRGGVLRIADNGPGIEHALRDRVFERGYSTREGGTGMGLFLARQICERYGWSLALSFPEAGGTVASVDFRSATLARDAG